MRVRPRLRGNTAVAPPLLLLFGPGFGFAFPSCLSRGDCRLLAFLFRFLDLSFRPRLRVELGWVCLGRGGKMGRAEVLGQIRRVSCGIPHSRGFRVARKRAHRPSRALGKTGIGLARSGPLPQPERGGGDLVVEKAQAILGKVRLVLRLRRALFALSASLFFELLLFQILRISGRPLFPPIFFWASLAPAFLAFLFPLRFSRVLFWASRRLGLGGKLPGLAAALSRKNMVFVAALLEDLVPRWSRLLFPEAFSFLPALFLCGLFLLPPPSAMISEPGSTAMESVSIPVESAAEERASRASSSGAEKEIPRFPPGTSRFSPYPLILAGLYGEEVTLEEALRRLSEEEGLLRRLAELLGRASGEPGSEEIAQEMAEILSALRPDLQQALSQALEPGNEDFPEAQAIVAAALEGLSNLQRDAEAAAGEEGGEVALGTEGVPAGPGEFREPTGEILLDEEAQPQMRKELEEAEEGLGLGAGWERGEPVQPGAPEERDVEAEPVLTPVRPGEGPWRTGVALGLPGENPGEEEGLYTVSPQEVEILLRERPLPPGLRELVRRYFELLSGGE